MHLFEYAYVAIALIKVLTGVNMLAVNDKLLVFTFTAASDPSIEHLREQKKATLATCTHCVRASRTVQHATETVRRLRVLRVGTTLANTRAWLQSKGTGHGRE